MINKKQMLMLMLGASIAGASFAADEAELANATIEKFKDTMATVSPLVRAFTSKAKKGDFQGIASDLSQVNLTPAVEFLIENMDTIKEKMNNFVKILQEQAPADYKATADATAEKVQQKLASLDSLKQELEVAKPYANLAAYQTIIEKALTVANNDKEFRDNLQRIIDLQGAAIQKLLGDIKQIKAAKIQQAFDAAQDLYKAYKVDGTLSLDDIEKQVAPGIGELRKKLLPTAPAIAAELAATAIDINNVFIKIHDAFEKSAMAQKTVDDIKKFILTDTVTAALQKINEIGVQLKDDFSALNENISDLVKNVL